MKEYGLYGQRFFPKVNEHYKNNYLFDPKVRYDLSIESPCLWYIIVKIFPEVVPGQNAQTPPMGFPLSNWSKNGNQLFIIGQEIIKCLKINADEFSNKNFFILKIKKFI